MIFRKLWAPLAALILANCGNVKDDVWVPPVQVCNYEVVEFSGGFEIKHDYCAGEVSLIDTINTERCITCQPWEMNPRKEDMRNDQGRMK